MKAKFEKNDKVKIVNVFNCEWLPMKSTKGKTGIVQGYVGALVQVKIDDNYYLYAENELEFDGHRYSNNVMVIADNFHSFENYVKNNHCAKIIPHTNTATNGKITFFYIDRNGCSTPIGRSFDRIVDITDLARELSARFTNRCLAKFTFSSIDFETEN